MKNERKIEGDEKKLEDEKIWLNTRMEIPIPSK